MKFDSMINLPVSSKLCPDWTNIVNQAFALTVVYLPKTAIYLDKFANLKMQRKPRFLDCIYNNTSVSV